MRESRGRGPFTVGDGGTIISTADAGRTWRRVHGGTRATLQMIDALDARHVWVAGEVGTILASHDGGENWQVQTTGTWWDF